MPTIRIDKDVYSWLESQAIPFKDTPNTVLRRLAGLDKRENSDSNVNEEKQKPMSITTSERPMKKQLNGKYLSRLWKVNVVHALYHHEGTFYENLRDFPGALFDFNGYVVFNTEREYNSSSYLDIGQKLNVRDGISSIPGYKRMR